MNIYQDNEAARKAASIATQIVGFPYAFRSPSTENIAWEIFSDKGLYERIMEEKYGPDFDRFYIKDKDRYREMQKEVGMDLELSQSIYEIQCEKSGLVQFRSTIMVDVWWSVEDDDFHVPRKYVPQLDDPKNWQEWKLRIPTIITMLSKCHEIAKRVGKECGVKLSVERIEGSDNYVFQASFDSSDMSREQFLKEIERHCRAMVDAYKQYEPWLTWSERKKHIRRLSIGQNISHKLIAKIARYLKGLTEAPYILKRNAIVLDKGFLDRSAMREVSKCLAGPQEVALPDPWGDERRALDNVWYLPDVAIVGEPLGTISIETGPLLLERFRGFFFGIQTPSGEIEEEVVAEAVGIADRITEKKGVRVDVLSTGSEDILVERANQDYTVPTFNFFAEFPTFMIVDEQELIDEILKRAKALRQAYLEWIPVRRAILEKHGIDTTALHVRDLLEAVQHLPPWSYMVTPTEDGYIAEVDDGYIETISDKISPQIREVGITRHNSEVEVAILMHPIDVGKAFRRYHAEDLDLPSEFASLDSEMALLNPQNLQYLDEHSPRLAKLLKKVDVIINQTARDVGPIKNVYDIEYEHMTLKVEIKPTEQELIPTLKRCLRLLVSAHKKIVSVLQRKGT